MKTAKTEQINITSDYSKFSLSEVNRDVNRDHPATKRLEQSMLKHGFLSAFPIMVRKVGSKLIVTDGQHRLAIAREYGIPVKYVVVAQDVCVSDLNDTSHGWVLEDHVKSHAKSGHPDYAEALEMHQKYGITLSCVCAMLANTIHTSNTNRRVKEGAWQIKNRPMAYAVAETYRSLKDLHPVFGNMSSLKVLWGCYEVPYFDPERMISQAKKMSGSITRVTRFDLVLEVFESVYNHGRKEKMPLKFDCQKALRERMAVTK